LSEEGDIRRTLASFKEISAPNTLAFSSQFSSSSIIFLQFKTQKQDTLVRLGRRQKYTSIITSLWKKHPSALKSLSLLDCWYKKAVG